MKDKEIPELLEEKERLARVANRLEKLREKLQASKLELEALELSVDEEYRDVERLEKLGITSLFQQVLGNKEEQLEHERQEYLEVVLRYNAKKKEIELTEYEIDVLEDQLSSRSTIEEKLDQKIREKELLLRNEHPDKVPQLTSMHKQMANLLMGKREVNEVIDLTKKVIPVLKIMSAHLKKAQYWGGGRAMAATGRELDKAKSLSYDAQQLLDRLSTELEDVIVNRTFVFKVKFESFTHFVDIFFNNLIADWIIQQKIRHSLNNILSVQSQVEQVKVTMEAELVNLNREINALKERKKDYIINA